MAYNNYSWNPRGRGRGRGVPYTNNCFSSSYHSNHHSDAPSQRKTSWVRSRDDKTGVGKTIHPSTKENEKETLPKKQPILKGAPKQQPVLLKGGHRVWKRPNNKVDNSYSNEGNDDKKTKSEERLPGKTIQKKTTVEENQTAYDIEKETIQINTNRTGSNEMKKRGRNQLVLVKAENKKNNSNKSSLVDSLGNDTTATTPSTDTLKKSEGKDLVKIGRNQLVLKKKQVPDVVHNNETPATKSEQFFLNMIMLGDDGQDEVKEGGKNQGELMKRRGQNKLILKKKSLPTEKRRKEDIMQPLDFLELPGKFRSNNNRAGLKRNTSNSLVNRGSNYGSGRNRGHKGKHFGDPSIKRIKLNTSDIGESSEIAEVSVEDTIQSLNGNSSSTEQSPQREQQNKNKALTDFAYQETSKVKSKPISKKKVPLNKWIRSESTKASDGSTRIPHVNGTTRNMGLVRVKPNTETTPVCTTFLKGIACTDETCTRRHDIPKEAAMPICSFFQRNGQCLKRESCPFRHIKVNIRTEVCPTFSMLGFCEDKDCVMKHVRVSSKSNRVPVIKNKSYIKKKKESK